MILRIYINWMFGIMLHIGGVIDNVVEMDGKCIRKYCKKTELKISVTFSLRF